MGPIPSRRLRFVLQFTPQLPRARHSVAGVLCECPQIPCRHALHASGRSEAENLAQNPAQIEAGHMNQQPLQEILAARRARPAHAAGVIAVRKAALYEFRVLPHQCLNLGTLDMMTIAIHRVPRFELPGCLGIGPALPVPSTAIRLRDIRPNPSLRLIRQFGIAVIAFFRHRFTKHLLAQLLARLLMLHHDREVLVHLIVGTSSRSLVARPRNACRFDRSLVSAGQPMSRRVIPQGTTGNDGKDD